MPSKKGLVSIIPGVRVTQLKTFFDDRGFVKRMLRVDDEAFQGFGEIYFSGIFPGVVKAWHLHREMTLNYAVVQGRILLVLVDNRSTSGRPIVEHYILDPHENYNRITIPPGIWNGFKNLSDGLSIVANCATLPHSPDEIVRHDPEALKYGDEPLYDWGVYNVGG